MVITGRSLTGLLVVTVAAVLLGSWLLWNRETPEAKVKAVIREMAACVNKPAGMKTSTELLKMRAFSGLFTDPCRLELSHTIVNGDYSPTQMGANLARFFSMLNQARGEVEDLVVEIHSPDQAEAEFTGILRGEDRSGRSVEERRELRTRLVCGEDGVWRVSSVVVRGVLER